MSETYAWDVQILANCSITMAYTGQGTVSVTPSGCLSPSSCACNQNITITATPAAGYVFTGWTGFGAGSYTGPETPHTMQLTANIDETATFVLSGSIGTLDEAGSTWYHGPFYPGQTNAYIARPHVGNNGYTGVVYRKYVYKDTSGAWIPIDTKQASIEAGQFAYYDDYITIPPTIQTCAPGSQCVRFGIKVWGTGETEPANPTMEWGQGRLEYNPVILGIIALAGIAGLLWYTKKKKIW